MTDGSHSQMASSLASVQALSDHVAQCLEICEGPGTFYAQNVPKKTLKILTPKEDKHKQQIKKSLSG